jgi:hypothetical protein
METQHALPVPTALSGHAEYARCRLALEKLQREDTLDANTDPVRLGLLFPGADSVPVSQRPALLRAIKSQAAELEAAHQHSSLAIWIGRKGGGSGGACTGRGAEADRRDRGERRLTVLAVEGLFHIPGNCVWLRTRLEMLYFLSATLSPVC